MTSYRLLRRDAYPILMAMLICFSLNFASFRIMMPPISKRPPHGEQSPSFWLQNLCFCEHAIGLTTRAGRYRGGSLPLLLFARNTGSLFGCQCKTVLGSTNTMMVSPPFSVRASMGCQYVSLLPALLS